MNAQIFYRRTANSIAAYLAQELNIKPGVHWVIRNATSGPRVLSLAVDINPKYASKIASMGEALSMAAMLDRGQSIRVGRGNRGALAIEIPKPEALWFNISIGSLPRRRGLLSPIGLDCDHVPALVDWSNPMTPHVLLAGATGSGKTNALRLLAYNLASQNEPGEVEFILIDTRKHGTAWRDFADVPHLGHPIVEDDDTALKILSWACAEIDRRAGNGKRKPHVFVGVDEAQDLLDREEFVKVIGDIASVGREFNIHLLAALQNPTARQLGDASIKRNLTTRLVGRVDSATAAHVATGQKDSGAELLTGAGDFLFIEPKGVSRLTAALLTEKDIAGLPRSESTRTLDLGEYEDADHVLAQADNGSKVRADDLDPAQVAIALVAERGITWLCNRLSIGSAKARRVLEFADELRDALKAMGAYTTIPPYQNDTFDDRNGQDDDAGGMVVCQYKEVDDD